MACATEVLLRQESREPHAERGEETVSGVGWLDGAGGAGDVAAVQRPPRAATILLTCDGQRRGLPQICCSATKRSVADMRARFSSDNSAWRRLASFHCISSTRWPSAETAQCSLAVPVMPAWVMQRGTVMSKPSLPSARTHLHRSQQTVTPFFVSPRGGCCVAPIWSFPSLSTGAASLRHPPKVIEIPRSIQYRYTGNQP